MPVSKRLRFEILRRDGFKCRYCGLKAEETELHIDHVIPESLGGTSQPDNLATACPDCNSGKSSTNPDAPLVADVDEAAQKWALAMQKAVDEHRADRVLGDVICGRFVEEWNEWRSKGGDGSPFPLGPSWERSIGQWTGLGLELNDLLEFIPIAMQSRANADKKWNYFCGIVWRTVRDLQQRACEIAGEDS